MCSVLNDPKASVERRDRMAIAAAPFMHTRGAELMPPGKKERAAAAGKAAAVGWYAPGPAPTGIKARAQAAARNAADGTDWEDLLPEH